MADIQSIGMMDQGYFVGRKEIVDWINDALDLNISKIEDTCSGAIACQLLDSLYPGSVPMHRINWNGRNDYEYIGNYKILQSTFSKLKIDKHVEVDKLIRGKYQDNLEFMQWFKRFFELKSPVADYDPVYSRSKAKGAPKGMKKLLLGDREKTNMTNSKKKVTKTSIRRKDKDSNSKNGISDQRNQKELPMTGGHDQNRRNTKLKDEIRQEHQGLLSNNQKLKFVNETLEKELTELEAENQILGRKTDFYFDKLRRIEIILQNQEDLGHHCKDMDLVKEMLGVLYEENDEFVAEPVETVDPYISSTLTDDVAHKQHYGESQSKDDSSILDKEKPIFYDAQAKECTNTTGISSDIPYSNCEKVIDNRNDHLQNQLTGSKDTMQSKNSIHKCEEFKSTSLYNEEESKVPGPEKADSNMCGDHQSGSQYEDEIPHDTTLV